MAELSGTDLSLPLVATVAALKHHATRTITWHAHDVLEIHYVLSGALTYEFAKGRSSCNIPGGSFLIIPAHTRHRAANNQGAPSVRLGIQLNPLTRESSQNTVFTGIELKHLMTTIRQHALMSYQFRTRTGSTAREIYNCVSEWPPTARHPDVKAGLRALVCTLLIQTIRELSDTRDVIAAGKVVPALMDYLRENCSSHISTDDLIRISGYGCTRLFSLFSSEAGTTPIDFLNRCRVEKAKELLTKTQKPLSEIASACGFSSAAYFALVFRKYSGCRPHQFRGASGKADADHLITDRM